MPENRSQKPQPRIFHDLVVDKAARAILLSFYAILLALIPTDAKAEHRIESKEHGFQITFPDSWSALDRKSPGSVVSYGESGRRNNGSIYVASCNIGASDAPSSKNKRQAEINSEIEGLLNSGAMTKNYAEARLAVNETYTRTIGGVRVLVAVGNTSENPYGTEIALIRQQSMFFRPGLGYVITCQATSSDFPKARLLFDRVSDSFRFE